MRGKIYDGGSDVNEKVGFSNSIDDLELFGNLKHRLRSR